MSALVTLTDAVIALLLTVGGRDGYPAIHGFMPEYLMQRNCLHSFSIGLVFLAIFIGSMSA